jgi:hypothetical protein
MSALQGPRNTPSMGVPEPLIPLGVAADTVVHFGGLAALDANGNVVPAQRIGADNLASLRVLGHAGKVYLGTPGQEAQNVSTALIPGTTLAAGAAGAIKVEIDTGIFLVDIGGSSITAADIGALCYAEDDHTVYDTSDTNARPVAGTIVGLEAGGVWVDTRKQSAIG